MGSQGLGGIVVGALKTGLLGLLIGPLIAIVLLLSALLLDPKCGTGSSGGCAMGLVTAPVAIALPSFAAFFTIGLIKRVWTRRHVLIVKLTHLTRNMRRD